MTDRKLDIRDAARYLGVSTKTVRRHIDSGKITAEKIKNVWYVTTDELDQIMKRPAKSSAKAVPETVIEEYMARLDVVLMAISDKISGINGRLDLLEEEPAGKAATSGNSSEELELLREENERLSAALERAGREARDVRENGHTADNQLLKNKSEEIEELRATIVSNRRGLTLLREEVARYKEELRRKESVIKDLKARLLELEQELAELRLGRKGNLLLGRRRDV